MPPHRPHQPPGTIRDDVACPLCGWHPIVGALWFCGPDGCGTVWDTFETGARCPGCDAQFAWTACLACGRRSQHSAWYRFAS